MMKLSNLLFAADIKDINVCEDIEISKIETNSGNVSADNAGEILFVCIKGANYDTHKDIEYLLKLGVKAIIAESVPESLPLPARKAVIISSNTRKTLALLSRVFFECPDKKLTLVAITGTKGKTTVTYMLSEICKHMNIKCGIIGTNGAFFDGRHIECINSTPGSIEFCTLLREMSDCGVRYVFCEVTSQALLQYRVYGMEFEIAAFTNLFPDHIGKDEHQSYEEYRECKSRLFEMCKRAVLNGDDKQFSFFADKCQKCSVPYTVFYPSRQSEKIRNYVRMPGSYNVANAVCARCIATELGFSEEFIIRGIESVKVFGRCESVENPCGVRIVIDYAHNKESLINILKALRESCRGRLLCVFGAGGDRSPLRRVGMGEASAEYADFSIVTSDNPRNEAPEKIIDDILVGMKGSEDRFTVIPDRKEAIFYALSIAKSDDTVLLAGKGSQLYEERCGKRYKFDEREVVAEYYKKYFTQN